MTTTTTKQLVGVRFREAGKTFYFDAADHDVTAGEYVVAETARGIEMGRVVIAPGQMLGGDIDQGARPVLRIATGEDRDAQAHWRERSKGVLEQARLHAGKTGVSMMIVSAEYNLDGSTLTLYYESEDHVDYRPVVRAVSGELNVAIQMERVGPRDRAKLADGYDRCGQRLCCSSWLTSFPNVSIKMAKEQNLALNPAKISGVCGRLYCCLTYEYETYRDLRGQLPKLNQRVSTPTGDAKVIAVNPLKQTVTLFFEHDHSRIEVTGEQIQYGKLVRPIDVEMGEPAYDEETKQAKTAFVPMPSTQGRPRQPGPRPSGATQPAPARRRPMRSAEPPRAAAPAPSEPQPPASPPSSNDDAAKKRRRRRRRRSGGGGPAGGDG